MLDPMNASIVRSPTIFRPFREAQWLPRACGRGRRRARCRQQGLRVMQRFSCILLVCSKGSTIAHAARNNKKMAATLPPREPFQTVQVPPYPWRVGVNAECKRLRQNSHRDWGYSVATADAPNRRDSSIYPFIHARQAVIARSRAMKQSLILCSQINKIASLRSQ